MNQFSQMIRITWENPSDTMTILLIIGGDIVGMALAQLSGSHIVPVAFSFGWIGYSFTTLMSVVGNGRLMPPPDYDAKLINTKNGFERDNHSWILGRLLRDFEHPLSNDVGLSITIFKAVASSRAGVPDKDWYWGSGITTIILQLVFAAVPLIQDGDWTILLITGAGTVLALITGALPQWRFEKWACRRKTKKTLCLTGGNGTRNVMVIIGDGEGLDLEDLAAAESPRLLRRQEERTGGLMMDLPLAYRITQVTCVALAALWILLLITVTGLKQNTWYLLLVGGLGMGQNVIVAGARRKPGASGIHLQQVGVFQRKKVMHTLMDVETAGYEGVGRSLLKVFFPEEGGLRSSEIKWWDGEKEEYDRERANQLSRVKAVTPETMREQTRYARNSPAFSLKLKSCVISPVLISPRTHKLTLLSVSTLSPRTRKLTLLSVSTPSPRTHKFTLLAPPRLLPLPLPRYLSLSPWLPSLRLHDCREA